MQEKPSKTRLKVLETAGNLFHRQGYQSTGINQIAEESKVVKSSIYQHFHSKEGLAAAYLNERHQHWFNLLNDFTAKAKNPAEKVSAAFEFIIFMNVKEDYHGCAFIKMLAETNNEQLIKIIRSHKEDVRTFFRLLLIDLPVSADIVYQLFESAMLESQLFKSDWPVITAKNFIHSIIN